MPRDRALAAMAVLGVLGVLVAVALGATAGGSRVTRKGSAPVEITVP